jgi:hypothetical protein
MLLDGLPVPTCYRYRTAVLVGPWRPRSKEAERDAIRAGQARLDSAGRLSWSVHGTIEEAAPAEVAEDTAVWSAH